MKLHLKALLVVIILGGIAVWGFNYFFVPHVQQTSESMVSLETMEKEGVPNFSALSLEGENFRLSDIKAKVIILNFWASWCAPCVEEVPSLIKLVREFNGDVAVVAISGDSSADDIRVFLKSFPELNNPHIKIVFDQDRSKMKMFEVARLPESIVLTRDHKLAKKIVGSINWYTADSIQYMKSLISK